ncbi:MAG: hypothetical protein JWR26_2292 [Pedosphaera sp.]|nr:hypothetical protein [Pedosphaera sp.]
MSLLADTDEAVELARQAREVEMFKHLVELQAKIIKVAQQNVEIEKQCLALRKELDLRNTGGVRSAQWFRVLRRVASRIAIPKAGTAIQMKPVDRKETSASTRASVISVVAKFVADARWRLDKKYKMP